MKPFTKECFHQGELTKANWAEGIDSTNTCRLINEERMRVPTKKSEPLGKQDSFEQNMF